jgi:Plasmid pRiA4b ORF-3-like protein
MMRDIQFTTDHDRFLREQAFAPGQPGSVLDDFGTVLEFLRYHKGVEATGKHNLLPMKLIGELDHCLSRPLHLEMKRPLLRSHPYLQGLNLLLRASALTRVEGVGTKARLCVDPSMLAQWEQLNSTEQYFNLLEAWLRFGRPEMVGETRGSGDGLLYPSVMAWRSLPAQGTQFDITRPLDVHVSGIYRHFYQLALMDLFGIVDVERPHRHVAPWCPAGIKRLPFGDALFTLITSRCACFGIGHFVGEKDEDQGEDGPELPTFGAWQSIFQPYFPDWRENLEFPALEPRDGTFIFRVLLGKVWRLIAISADATLDALVHWVLRSVNLDSDHLYSVTYRDRMGTRVCVNSPEGGDAPFTHSVQIGALPLEPGQTMDLLYDFGDNWEFTIKLDRIEPPATKIKAPAIIESHGKAPEQYPQWDE